MDLPDRYPAFAADPALSASEAAEPGGGTATSGYPAGAQVPHEGYNWMWRYTGWWGRWLGAHSPDLADSHNPGLGKVYRLTTSEAAAMVGGGLVQPLASGGSYLIDGERVIITPDLAGPLTWAASSTNYLHARVAPLTTRETGADVLVSTNPTETGYSPILQVTTDATTVTASAEVATVLHYLPDDLARAMTGWLSIAPPLSTAYANVPALAVTYPNSGAVQAGVEIAAGVGAAPGCLRLVPGPASAYGLNITGPGSGALQLLEVTQSGVGTGIAGVFAHTDGGTALYATASQGGGGTTGRAITAMAGTGAAGLVAEAVDATANAPLRVVPQAWAPANPTDGDIWLVQGVGYFAPRFRESSVDFVMWATQDGPSPVAARTTGTSSLGGGVGSTTLVSTSVYFRAGGTYRIGMSVLCGRTAGSTAIPSFTLTIAGAVDGGWNARAVDVPNPGGGVGTYPTMSLADEIDYYHAGADGLYTVSLRVQTSAGSGNVTFANRRLSSWMMAG